MTAIARDVEAEVPLFTNRVSRTRRQLRSTDSEITTIAALRGAWATVADGIGGIKYGSRPVHLTSERQAVVRDAAISWWHAVTEAVGGDIEDRQHKPAGAPAVLAAIGAVGHPLATHTYGERSAIVGAQLEKL